MLSKRNGVVVCISSICGVESIPGAPIAYSVSKAALNHYVKIAANSLAQKNIRINAIAPGNILFKGSTWDKKMKANKKKVYKMIHDNVALKKFGTPNDISSLTMYLSSDLSSFATGSIWTIDGGQTKSF